jgi:hypothetical protein
MCSMNERNWSSPRQETRLSSTSASSIKSRAKVGRHGKREPAQFLAWPVLIHASLSSALMCSRPVDLITANLMLAEDRILSYAVVLMAHTPVHTDFVPDALFFFEAETEAENALQQSRRWTNGTGT